VTHALETVPTVLVPAPPPVADRYDKAGWGMLVVIATEGMIFLVLLAANFFLRATAKEWPPPGIEQPELLQASIYSVVLIGSSVPVFWADAAIKRGHIGQAQLGLLLSWLMGAVFLVHTVFDFDALHFGWRDNSYGSIYYTVIGLHALHVFVGLLFGGLVQVKLQRGLLDANRHLTLDVFSLYWHFVDVVWIFVFSSLIVSVHIR